MALLVDQELALGALEALATQAPDAVVAIGARGALKRKGNVFTCGRMAKSMTSFLGG